MTTLCLYAPHAGTAGVGDSMIRDPDMLADIINELSEALEPKRAADGQLARHAMERARAKQAKVVPRIMARLALKASVEDVAEILSGLAVELGIAKDKDAARRAYLARLVAEPAPTECGRS